MEMKKNGFTLIEIMVVVGILGIIAAIGSGAFFSILRGSTKTKTLQMVKQNGDYAISVMGRMIRNARKIEFPTITGESSFITIKNPDGGTTTFKCCEVGFDALIASESGSLVCQDARLTSSEVKIENCSGVFNLLDVGQPGVKPAVVKINFNLKQAGTASRPEEQAVVNFQTTITLRNY